MADTIMKTDYQSTTNNGGDNTLLNYGPKRGHSCCGSCCDMRRAVIIVNSIVFSLALFGIFESVSMKRMGQYYANSNITSTYNNITSEDAATIQSNYEQLATMNLTGVLVMGISKMIWCLIGFIGAIKFNPYMVSFAGGCYVLMALYVLISFFTQGNVFAFFGIIECLLYAYPHYYFVKEYYSGVMTKSNYINEKQSCCCV